MRRGRRTPRTYQSSGRRLKRPEMRISPMNRNFSDDPSVVEKISVHSIHSDNEGQTASIQPNQRNSTQDTENIQNIHRVPKKGLLQKISGRFADIKTEDLILAAIIFLLFTRRDEDIDDSHEDCYDESDKNQRDGLFNLERIKKMIPIDKLSENDILLALMVYLLF